MPIITFRGCLSTASRISLLVSAAVTFTLTGGGIANAAQAGNDTSGSPANAHWWMKVSASELQGKTVDKACVQAVGRDGAACNHLVVLVVQQKITYPSASGYWAEWYYNTGRTRAGTW